MSLPVDFGSLNCLRNQPLHIIQNQVLSAVLHDISFVGSSDQCSGFQPFCWSGTPMKNFSGSRNPHAIIQLFYTICVASGGTPGMN